MHISLSDFEKICRRAHIVNEANSVPQNIHPFESRNLFPNFPKKARKLFDDGHYSEATFEALKFLDKRIQSISGSRESGYKLMMQVLDKSNPRIKLNSLLNQSEIDEQEGFRFIFAGIMSAIRNPKGHEYSIEDDLDTCLDHLTVISTLLRRVEDAGYDVVK